eukprot:jgi/Mesen1/6807/ME000035S06188
MDHNDVDRQVLGIRPPLEVQMVEHSDIEILPQLAVMGEVAVTPTCKRHDPESLWGYAETMDFIAIRAELERDFVRTKRNKTLWEIVSGKMRERGHKRSSSQCKCKWKNLVNRYKGKELEDSGRQFQFYDELDSIFRERAKTMDRLLLDPEGGVRPPKRKRRGVETVGGGDETEEEDEEEEEEDDGKGGKKKVRTVIKLQQKVTADKHRANSMQEVLDDFFQQQLKVEEEWKAALDRRDAQTRMHEAQWREMRQALEHERLARQAEWKQREEQRLEREEARSQRRDELLSILIHKLASRPPALQPAMHTPSDIVVGLEPDEIGVQHMPAKEGVHGQHGGHGHRHGDGQGQGNNFENGHELGGQGNVNITHGADHHLGMHYKEDGEGAAIADHHHHHHYHSNNDNRAGLGEEEGVDIRLSHEDVTGSESAALRGVCLDISDPPTVAGAEEAAGAAADAGAGESSIHHPILHSVVAPTSSVASDMGHGASSGIEHSQDGALTQEETCMAIPLPVGSSLLSITAWGLAIVAWTKP